MFGLNENELQKIKKIFAKYPQIEKAIVYGSRAVGNYKDGSDIDIVLMGNNLKKDLFYIYDELDNNLSYFIDINDYNLIKNKNLKRHINKVGKSIYEK